MSSQTFSSFPFNPFRTASWIHIGDPHITRAGEPNERDLGKIVDEINAIYAKGGIDFVSLPDDIADDGSEVAYQAVRSFANFQTYVALQLYGYSLLLVDMGHTHYNELGDDGTVLYSATRSTGQTTPKFMSVPGSGPPGAPPKPARKIKIMKSNWFLPMACSGWTRWTLRLWNTECIACR